MLLLQKGSSVKPSMLETAQQINADQHKAYPPAFTTLQQDTAAIYRATAEQVPK